MANEFKHGTVGTTLTQAEFEAVGLHVINSQATGDVIYASSATQLSRLAIGATNRILTVVGGVPTWQAPLVSRSILISAKNFVATAGSAAAGLQGNTQTIDLDDTSQEDISATWMLPDKWDAGNITANLLWCSAAAVAGDCKWTLYWGSAAESEAVDVALTSASVTDTTDGVAGDLNITANITVTAAGLGGAAGDMTNFIIRRVAADAADTLVGDARLVGLKLSWTDNSV